MDWHRVLSELILWLRVPVCICVCVCVCRTEQLAQEEIAMRGGVRQAELMEKSNAGVGNYQLQAPLLSRRMARDDKPDIVKVYREWMRVRAGGLDRRLLFGIPKERDFARGSSCVW